MRETIARLKRLQEIDNRVRQSAVARDALRERLQRLHDFLNHFAAMIDEKRGRLEEAERFLSERRGEQRQDLDLLHRLQARLGGLGKAKELNAALKEIETLKKSERQKAEEIDKLNEEIEKFREGIRTEEAELEAKRAEVAEEEAKSDTDVQSLTAEIDSVAEESTAVERELPAGLVRRFRRIAERRDGLAVVPCNEGQCMGCHRQIPPQLRIVLLRTTSLETCPFCSRFLYVPEEELLRLTSGNGV